MTKEDLIKKVFTDKLYVRDSDVSWLSDKWIYDKYYVHHANTMLELANFSSHFSLDI